MLRSEWFNTDAVIELAWTQIWQVAAVAVLVAVVTAICCRRRPHLAYLLWMLVLVKAVTPPLWSSPTGAFSWALAESVPVVAAAPLTPPAPPLPAIEFSESTRPAQVPADPMPENPPIAEALPPTRRALTLNDALLIAWATGVIGLGVWLTVNWLLLARRIRRTSEQPDTPIAEQFAAVKQRIGLRRPVRLLVSRQSHRSVSLGPAALGWWRGTVLVPDGVIEQSTPTELDAIFAHELVHLRRCDPLIGTLQLAVQCVWWWHPAVWWANRQVRIERERSCDEAVLAQVDVRPTDYAKLLVELLRSRRAPVPAVFWSGMRSTSATTARVRHVLETKSFRRRSPLAAWMIAALALVIVLPGAGSRFITAAPPEQAKQEATSGQTQQLIERLDKLGLRITPVNVNGQRKLFADFDANFQPLAEPLPLESLPRLESIAIGDRRNLSEEQLIARLQAVRNLRPETNLLVFFKPDQGAAFDVLAEIPNLKRLGVMTELPPMGGKTGRKITLSELKNVRELSLLGNFSDDSLMELAPLNQLEVLQLYQEKPFAKLDLACLENKPRLRQFVTGGIEPTDEGFAQIGKLSALEHLMTDFTSATDAGMSDLARVANLKTLTLSSSQEPSRVTPEGMLAIGKLTKLVNLTISGKFSRGNPTGEAEVGDRIVAGWVPQLKQLKTLHLFNCRLGDSGLGELSKLPALVRLNLSGELEITDDGMAHLGTITTLKQLSLSNAAVGDRNAGVTNEGLSRLKALTRMESPALYNSPQVTDAGLAPLAGFSKLQKLVITNAKIEGRGLAPFTTLTSLSLENNPVDDAGVEILVRNKGLSDLNLSGTKITDKAFKFIGANLPNLKRLNVRQTQLTDAGLEALKPLKHLREVRAAGTKITQAGKDSLKSVVDFGNDWTVTGEVGFFSLEVD